MPQTIAQQLSDGLIKLGATPLPKKNKYSMFKLGPKYFFVGKAGALRTCSRPNAAASVVCHDVTRQKVLTACNEKAGAEELGF